MATGTYRHRVTGLVAELSERTARGMGDVLEKVDAGAKRKVSCRKLVQDKATAKKEKKNG